jgi:hypothetical protein
MNDSYPAVTLRDLDSCHFSRYSLKNIPCFENGRIFLINEINRSQAEEDIMLLNDIFIAAHKTESEFPLTRLYTDDIRFEASDALDVRQFCHLEIYDKTPEDNTGYVLILHYYITPDPRNVISGDIYYLSDGSIGKYNTVFEHENDIFYINCKKNGSRLEVYRVVCDKGKRKKRFYPYIKIGMRAAYFISGVFVIITVAAIMTAFYIYDNIKPEDDSLIVIKPVTVTSAISEQPQTLPEVIIIEDTASVTAVPETEAFSDSAAPETEPVIQTVTTSPEPQDDITVLTIISFNSPVTQGNAAKLKIQGKPDTVYSISLYYSSGKSSAAGLEDKTSDSSGYAEWNWRIGSRTKTGTYKIEIKGGGEILVTEIIITE